MRLARCPDDYSVWGALGDACKKLNGLGELRELAKQTIVNNATNYHAWSALAEACKPPEKPDDAIALAKQAITESSENGSAWDTLQSVYTAHGKQDEFINFCNKYPTNSVAIFALGETQMARGQLADAAAAFRKVAQVDTNGFLAWENLVLVYHRQGQYDRAKESYQALLKLEPGFAERKAGDLQIERRELSWGTTNRPPAELRREQEIWQHYIGSTDTNQATITPRTIPAK